jgi:uncharacterized protein (TIGR02391 family)
MCAPELATDRRTQLIPFNETVVRLRDGEAPVAFAAHVIDEEHISLGPNSDMDRGDLIEWVNPAGRTKRLRVIRVAYPRAPAGFGGRSQLDHTALTLEPADDSRPPAANQPATIQGLHPLISDAAGGRFAAGLFSDAVFAAFKAIEVRVKALSPVDLSGKKLMGQTFGGSTPKLDVATTTGQSAVDEREGFNQLFMGAMQGIRDPRGHGELDDSAEEAMEYLAVASMLMRRLDIAVDRRP